MGSFWAIFGENTSENIPAPWSIWAQDAIQKFSTNPILRHFLPKGLYVVLAAIAMSELFFPRVMALAGAILNVMIKLIPPTYLNKG